MPVVTSVRLDWNLNSGRARNPQGRLSKYPQLYKEVNVTVNCDSAAHECVTFEYFEHRRQRDCYAGDSHFLGPLVLKFQPSTYNSSMKEWMLIQAGFVHAVPCLWCDNIHVVDTIYSILLQRRLPTLEYVLRQFVTFSPLTPAALHDLVKIKIRRTIEMWLDVDASGFTFSDSGPHNLSQIAENDICQIVFCHWEHNERSYRKPDGLCNTRRVFDQSFERLLACASSFMADNPQWGSLGMALMDTARNYWWSLLSDSVLSGSDRQWLDKGLNEVLQILITTAWPHAVCAASAALPDVQPPPDKQLHVDEKSPECNGMEDEWFRMLVENYDYEMQGFDDDEKRLVASACQEIQKHFQESLASDF